MKDEYFDKTWYIQKSHTLNFQFADYSLQQIQVCNSERVPKVAGWSFYRSQASAVITCREQHNYRAIQDKLGIVSAMEGERYWSNR